MANTKQAQVQRIFYDQCRYCGERHRSDKCYHFKTMEERKKQLKIVVFDV